MCYAGPSGIKSMSPKKHSRKRVFLKSTSYRQSDLLRIPSDLIRPVNYEYEKELLVLVGQLADLNVRQICTRFCQLRGPWTADSLQTELVKYGKLVPLSSIRSAFRDLVKFGVIVKANGGYCIRGWDK